MTTFGGGNTHTPTPLLACVCPPVELLLHGVIAERNSAAAVLASIIASSMADSSETHLALAGRAGIAAAGTTNVSVHCTADERLLFGFAGTLENRSSIAHEFDLMEDDSDSTMVAALYRKLKPRQLVAKLQGRWTLVAFDLNQERAFGASSEDGIIPLYQVCCEFPSSC